MVKILWEEFTKNELCFLIVCLFAHANVFALFSIQFTNATMQIRFYAKLNFYYSNFWFRKKHVCPRKNDN